jgi:hypothetical protein
VYVEPPHPHQPAKSEINARTGYAQTLKNLLYFDPQHARYEEGMNDIADSPPNAQLVRFFQQDASCMSCINQPCMRLFFTLSAAMGFVVMGADCTNAYANSPSPTQPTYARIDDTFVDWYRSSHGKEVDRSSILPVLKALQGHPEAGLINTKRERHTKRSNATYRYNFERGGRSKATYRYNLERGETLWKVLAKSLDDPRVR